MASVQVAYTCIKDITNCGHSKRLRIGISLLSVFRVIQCAADVLLSYHAPEASNYMSYAIMRAIVTMYIRSTPVQVERVEVYTVGHVTRSLRIRSLQRRHFGTGKSKTSSRTLLIIRGKPCQLYLQAGIGDKIELVFTPMTRVRFRCFLGLLYAVIAGSEAPDESGRTSSTDC